MPPRVFLHVGSPKTGTTFLQNVLWAQRQLAQQQGLLLPLRGFHDHFHATLDVRELIGTPRYRDIEPGKWDALVEQAEGWEGTVLASHELFAGATYAQAEKAVGAFAPGTEVHVVVTARDLSRQLPAEWQEHIKHRYTRDFADFLAEIEHDPAHETWFWKVQDVPDVLDRWGHLLPRDRVHVVTIPPAGADPTVLWGRFATLLGLDPESFDLEESRSNTSLGAEQAELLRRFNLSLGDRLPMGGGYPPAVKEVLAHRVLSARQGTPLRLGGADLTWAVRRSAAMVEQLRTMQVDVVGDLDDLVPRAEEASGEPSGTASEQAVAAETMEALIGMTQQHRGLQTRFAAYRDTSVRDTAALRRQLDDASAERDQLRHDMQHRPVRHMFVGLSERWRVVMALRMGFHRAKNAVRSGWHRLRGKSQTDEE